MREYYWWAQKDSMIILCGGRHPPLFLPRVGFSVVFLVYFFQIFFKFFISKKRLILLSGDLIRDLIKKKHQIQIYTHALLCCCCCLEEEKEELVVLSSNNGRVGRNP